MNLLLLNQEDFVAPDRVKISGRRFLQLRDVIGLEAGKKFRAGLVNGKVGSAEVKEFTSEEAELSVALNAQPPEEAGIDVVIALPRPQTFRKVIHGMVSMGVKRIWFINSRKVEKSFWQASMLHDDELDLEFRLALEQSGDTVMPQVELRTRFKPFVEDELPQLAAASSLALFGHPRATQPVPPRPQEGRVLLAVGPEGGFTDYENTMLESAGLTPVTLGARVLRTEFAVAALLAKLS